MTTENLSDARAEASASAREVAFAESVIETGDGTRLHCRVAEIAGPIRADVLLTHGLGEHTGRYGHVAAMFAAHGLRLLAYDLRGHGRSSGRRGDVTRYEDLLDDLRAVSAQAPWSGGIL